MDIICKGVVYLIKMHVQCLQREVNNQKLVIKFWEWQKAHGMGKKGDGNAKVMCFGGGSASRSRTRSASMWIFNPRNMCKVCHKGGGQSETWLE